MKKLALGFLVCFAMTAPALAQKKQAAQPADPCAPIGKTSDGRMVYSLKCDAIPAPVAPPSSAAVAPAPPPEEEDKGGLFRNPFPSIIRPTNAERTPGVGPAGGR
jgi:hypothetical protein